MYRQRFSLTHHPIPKDAHGKTFYDKAPGYVRLKRSFMRLRVLDAAIEETSLPAMVKP